MTNTTAWLFMVDASRNSRGARRSVVDEPRLRARCGGHTAPWYGTSAAAENQTDVRRAVPLAAAPTTRQANSRLVSPLAGAAVAGSPRCHRKVALLGGTPSRFAGSPARQGTAVAVPVQSRGGDKRAQVGRDRPWAHAPLAHGPGGAHGGPRTCHCRRNLMCVAVSPRGCASPRAEFPLFLQPLCGGVVGALC